MLTIDVLGVRLILFNGYTRTDGNYQRTLPGRLRVRAGAACLGFRNTKFVNPTIRASIPDSRKVMFVLPLVIRREGHRILLSEQPAARPSGHAP
jgi:hypothetical protein